MQIFNVIKSFYGLFYAIHNSRFLQRLTAMWVAFFFYFRGKRPAVYRANKPANVESTAAKRAVAEYALLGGSDTVFLPFRRENAPGGKAKKKEELLYLCVDFGDVYAEKLA